MKLLRLGGADPGGQEGTLTLCSRTQLRSDMASHTTWQFVHACMPVCVRLCDGRPSGHQFPQLRRLCFA